MSDLLQIGLWGIAALIPLALNWTAHRLDRGRYVDALGLSVLLLMLWAIYNLIIITPPGRPENMIPLSVMDLIALMIVLTAWVSRPKVYKLILAGLFLLQLATHAAFWLAWPRDGLLYTYSLALNVTFMLQLVVCGFPGGRALVRRGFNLGFSPRGHRFHLGSGPR